MVHRGQKQSRNNRGGGRARYVNSQRNENEHYRQIMGKDGLGNVQAGEAACEKTDKDEKEYWQERQGEKELLREVNSKKKFRINLNSVQRADC